MFSFYLLKNSNQHFRPLSWWRWVGSKTCEGAANLIWHSFQFMSFGFLRDRWFYKQLRQIRPWAAEGCLSSICSKSNLEWKSSKISAAFFAHTTLPLSLPPLKCDILTRSFSSLDACNVFFSIISLRYNPGEYFTPISWRGEGFYALPPPPTAIDRLIGMFATKVILLLLIIIIIKIIIIISIVVWTGMMTSWSWFFNWLTTFENRKLLLLLWGS